MIFLLCLSTISCFSDLKILLKNSRARLADILGSLCTESLLVITQCDFSMLLFYLLEECILLCSVRQRDFLLRKLLSLSPGISLRNLFEYSFKGTASSVTWPERGRLCFLLEGELGHLNTVSIFFSQ